MSAIRTIKIAGVQVDSRNLDVQGNLQRAEVLVAVAAGRGAELIVCPELMAAGHVYHRSIWDAAEPRGGATEAWLERMARQHRVYIGATYLEAEGDDFFNTFTLMKPDGTVAGRARKESLPGFEGWFFRSCSGSKVIETEFGRVGVGICWDNSTTRFMRRMSAERVDLLVMPHSAPYFAIGPVKIFHDDARRMLRGVAELYARAFGVATVMVNKASGAESSSPVPCVPLVRLRMRNMGQSTICGADGVVCDRSGEEEGVVFAEVELDAARERRLAALPTGYWTQPPRLFPRTCAGVMHALEWIGKAAYTLSRSRCAAARSVKR